MANPRVRIVSYPIHVSISGHHRFQVHLRSSRPTENHPLDLSALPSPLLLLSNGPATNLSAGSHVHIFANIPTLVMLFSVFYWSCHLESCLWLFELSCGTISLIKFVDCILELSSGIPSLIKLCDNVFIRILHHGQYLRRKKYYGVSIWLKLNVWFWRDSWAICANVYKVWGTFLNNMVFRPMMNT